MAPWEELIEPIENPDGRVTIQVVGKYVGLDESYKSLSEALVHGGLRTGSGRNRLGEAESGVARRRGASRGAVGVLIPGGFGTRGSRGRFAPLSPPAREDSLFRHLLRIPVGRR